MFSSGEHRSERLAAEQVHVQVEHHLAAVLVAVDDEPEAVLGDAFRLAMSRATMNMWPSVRSSSSLTSLAVGIGLLGTMSTCTGACGLMSRKAVTRRPCGRWWRGSRRR